MSKDELFEKFKNMFPGWEDIVNTGSDPPIKVGSRTIKMIIPELDNQPVYFMYKSNYDWSFGTKIWRSQPGNNKKGD